MTEENKRPEKVIFVITTDGMENSSTEFTYAKVKELISHQQDKYNCEFIFLGANIHATHEADSIGISKDNAYSFEASKDGVEVMYNMACEAVSERRNKKKK